MKYLLLTIAAATIVSCAGTPPSNLGASDGDLAPCPDSPNCVSSQSSEADTVHYIEPFGYSTDRETAASILVNVLEQTPRITVVSAETNYVLAEARTKIMRFVDDLEFYFDPAEPVIHLRSASRLGYGDLGENRKRIEMLRELFYSALSETDS